MIYKPFMRELVILCYALLTGCAIQPSQPLTPAQQQILLQNYRPQNPYQPVPFYPMQINRTTPVCQMIGSQFICY